MNHEGIPSVASDGSGCGGLCSSSNPNTYGHPAAGPTLADSCSAYGHSDPGSEGPRGHGGYDPLGDDLRSLRPGIYHRQATGPGDRGVQFIVEDDQYNPANTVAAAKKLVEQDEVFAIVRPLGTATTAAILDYTIEKGVPVVGVASGSSLWSKPFKKTVFGIQPTYELEGRLMALKARGIEPVAMVPYEVTEQNFSAHALKLQQANPDLVFVYAIQVPAASLLKEAQKLGFRPKWLMTYVLADPILLALAGEAAEGAYAGAWLVDPENAPEAAKYREVLTKYFPDEKPGGYSISSYAVAEIVVEALKRAGPDLTREKFIAALESLKNFTTGLTPPFSYSETEHQGIKQIAIVQVQKGKWVPVKEFFGE